MAYILSAEKVAPFGRIIILENSFLS